MFRRDGEYICGWKGVPITSLVVLVAVRIGLLLPERCYNMLRMGKMWDGNRGKIDIIAEILRQLRVPTVRTNIMSHCNMSSAQSGQYLTFMQSSDLIQIDAIRGMVKYQRTVAGREFLDLYNKMILLLDPSVSAPSLF
jgi:predicted transcriptional regulator